MLKRFIQDEAGVTAIEYGLIASLIFLVIVSAVSLFATNATGMFDKISAAVTGATG